jgi:hypothetical protein
MDEILDTIRNRILCHSVPSRHISSALPSTTFTFSLWTTHFAAYRINIAFKLGVVGDHNGRICIG